MSQKELAIVGILDLQVVVAPDGDGWIAQGLEIDYAAGGDSPDDARTRFGHGLRALIHIHLEKNGVIDALIVPASLESWKDLLPAGMDSEHWLYSTVSFHKFLPPGIKYFPFANIRYNTFIVPGTLQPEVVM